MPRNVTLPTRRPLDGERVPLWMDTAVKVLPCAVGSAANAIQGRRAPVSKDSEEAKKFGFSDDLKELEKFGDAL